jgi:uncharacterized protein (TIGR03435 family)
MLHLIIVAAVQLPLCFQPDAPAFEVASVRPASKSEAQDRGAGLRSTGFKASSTPGVVTYRNSALIPVLQRAYDVKSYQISGPEWLKSERYDIVAKIPEGAHPQQIPGLLRGLLSDRFKMKAHWETSPQRVYALVVGKDGPHLKKSEVAADPGLVGSETAPANRLSFDPQGHLEIAGVTLGSFADILTNFLGRPTLDLTDVPGVFDIQLNISMQDLAGLTSQTRISADDGSPDAGSSSVFAAVESLGLRLVSRRMDVKRVVIDELLRVPTDN